MQMMTNTLINANERQTQMKASKDKHANENNERQTNEWKQVKTNTNESK